MQNYYKWHEISNLVIEFDIDSVIFDRYKFLSAMENLYKQLGFDDFNPALVGEFWQRYIDLHQNM
jgi:hypothetical protein